MGEQPEPAPPRSWTGYLRNIGPGIAMAATGVGAGDLVAASAVGARYGFVIAWAAVIGAALKYVLNEGLARWQLATGTTLLEGWAQRLGRGFAWFFLAYLVLWSFVVGGALTTACGLAGHALAPALSVQTWGIVHALAAAAFVVAGGYERFEKLIKLFVALMFVTLVGCALAVQPPLRSLREIVAQAGVPPGGVKAVLSVMGGVGGSVTLLAYGYWIREKRWEGTGWLKSVRVDLAVAYALTGLFGLAVMVLAAVVLRARGIEIASARAVIGMSAMVGELLGPAGSMMFLLGFWGAVATSMLGVWQADPYLFCDFVGLMKGLPADQYRAMISTRSVWYRGYLLWLVFPPMVLLWLPKPVAVVMVYTVVGALFVPFLAATLLYMNNRRDWVGDLRSGWVTNLALILALALFAYLGLVEIAEALA